MQTRFNIVLVRPEIPQNTGNIGRLCVNTDTTLHLVKPLGFSLDDKHVKRAGMDYWSHLSLVAHDSLEDYFESTAGVKRYFFSTKAVKTHYECPFESGAHLIFGNEGSGLPDYAHVEFADLMYTIPMSGRARRSLNLANSAAIVLYEALRPGR
ncbi:MAG: tRNA (cytidine(34)-2'-O)-methyltransferase [Kiritimatiellaeota bacterium]|nr:tRNA (cytidine(34)-2'-O)-methyltransferase [Kiritimatiellota bacterium]